MKKLAGGLGGAIGSKYLKTHNQLVFTEYSGFLSRIDLLQTSATVVSQGTVVIKGTWLFDCETGTNTSNNAAADIWWEQIDTVKRQMVPQGNARIVNLGVVNFGLITPASLQTYAYGSAPIIGNNDPSNKLVNGDVFCVQTREGNYCKLHVVTYGYDLKVDWVTYKLNPSYVHIGAGYTNPEDIFVLSDEKTAYVTERPGNLLKVDLTNANRTAAAVVCSGLTAPQQLWVDEVHHQAWVVEYANPGRLVRVNLINGTKTVVYSGLNSAVGLILSSDLSFAYVGEQGVSTVSRIDLSNGTRTVVASGFTAPFFLTWADAAETQLLVPERDPANKISLVDITKTTGNVTPFITGTAARPSSISMIQTGTYCVCCDSEVDEYFLTAGVNGWLYKGIGYVPWNLVTAGGKADTSTQPAYPFQFPKDSPFGGTLPVNIDHHSAWNDGVVYYRVFIDNHPRFDVWNELVLNTSTGHYDIIELQKPDVNGFYPVHTPAKVYYNSDLGCLMDSTNLANALHNLTVEFYNALHVKVSAMGNALMVNNQMCVATLDVPTLNGVAADPGCGYLKYADKTRNVELKGLAAHPQGFATWSFGVIKGVNSFYGQSGALFPVTSFSLDYLQTVNNMLGSCPIVAAFAESLYVASTVINGVGRQSQYDASASVAFCLAP